MARTQGLTIHTSTEPITGSEPGAAFYPHSGIHLRYATIAALQATGRQHFDLLDPAEQVRAQRFLHAADRERFIAGHGFLRRLLGLYLGIRPQDVVMLRGEFGKPYLADAALHFNLSDTKDAILVALAEQPVGADIETMRRRTDHERVADHYFTPRETASIRAATDGKRRFLELWTRKEAVLKASGVGLMDDLHSLEVGEAVNRMAIQHPDFMRMAAPSYFLHTFHPGPDHIISVATASPVDVIQLSEGLPG